jgi:uncharacterized protein YjbJ (UPF0337 family)
MMNDQLAAIAGKYESLVGELQERYGVAREEARGHAARYKDTVEQLKKSQRRIMELRKSMIKKENPDGTGEKKQGRKHKAR